MTLYDHANYFKQHAFMFNCVCTCVVACAPHCCTNSSTLTRFLCFCKGRSRGVENYFTYLTYDDYG